MKKSEWLSNFTKTLQWRNPIDHVTSQRRSNEANWYAKWRHREYCTVQIKQSGSVTSRRTLKGRVMSCRDSQMEQSDWSIDFTRAKYPQRKTLTETDTVSSVNCKFMVWRDIHYSMIWVHDVCIRPVHSVLGTFSAIWYNISSPQPLLLLAPTVKEDIKKLNFGINTKSLIVTLYENF